MDNFQAASIMAMVIPFIVELLKKLKLPVKAAPITAMILGALAGIGAFLAHMVGDITMIQAIIAGIAIGGTSTGLYDIKKQFVDKK